ncbi:hypothetical protein F3Y22_tig00111947pilonHSYRG00116 [Hibiscus syriacus]|uniref:DNA (Cytosine-5)-methyltransferase DRM1/2 n=1 Tax=Hibiscus syriacus TaxID=106335 RepID=A0A6A2X837_HIBSY|nr:hypothetical protein F3Y22_tig00111947pilonHSYRG00116 [Hibiscus syriacus]
MKRSFRMISQILIVLSDTEEILNSDSDEENKLLYLKKIGYSEVEIGSHYAMISITSKGGNLGYDLWKRKKHRKLEKKLLNEDDHAVHLSIPMIGSGVPTEPDQITQRTLPEDAIGSPYFYYEQIHLLNPMIGFGVHTKSDQITQRTLPEDAIGSSYFYYEHMALAPVNVWIGISQNKVAPLEPDEVEMLLGFPKNHTRGGGSARDMFPGGINVLSLFSGINDAEVAFYCLGILLKTDVQELNDDRLEQLMSSLSNSTLSSMASSVTTLLEEINIIRMS